MVVLHPDIRIRADIRLLFPGKAASASPGGYPPALAGILGYPPFKRPARHRLEGFPSSRQGACTSSAGRNPFWSTRYMYLVDWKDFLPAGKVHAPRWLEGNPSSRTSPLLALGILWDTRIPAQISGKRAHPNPNPYPLAGIRWRLYSLDDWKESLLAIEIPSRLYGLDDRKESLPAIKETAVKGVTRPLRGTPSTAEKFPSAFEAYTLHHREKPSRPLI
ncbi:hypothetical protein PGTUg99_015964 [Puccinia graminis f. sp. tritici]|uniref:Uncharacterized protein n=1 Tax=Puccinia graminis f. sp. tritici TaxID=56615 RepID=A0A5B0NET0_PUCGR|nr:hypothetical protein PGTUg99_015964 [Puccinia graminis f. sp. tritici]